MGYYVPNCSLSIITYIARSLLHFFSIASAVIKELIKAEHIFILFITIYYTDCLDATRGKSMKILHITTAIASIFRAWLFLELL